MQRPGNAPPRGDGGSLRCEWSEIRKPEDHCGGGSLLPGRRGQGESGGQRLPGLIENMATSLDCIPLDATGSH